MIGSFYEQNPEKKLDLNSLPRKVHNSIIEEVTYSEIKPISSELFPRERSFYITKNKTALELNPAFGRNLEWNLVPFPEMVNFHEVLELARKYDQDIPFQSELFSLSDRSQKLGYQTIGGEEGIFKDLLSKQPSRYACLLDHSAFTGDYFNLHDGTYDAGCLPGRSFLTLVKEH